METVTDKELEFKKLENEQLSLKNDRLKIIADAVKIIFSAGIISLATVFINNEYQERQVQLERADKKKELELARIEKENEFIRQFVNDISEESIEVKKEITRYFSMLLPDGKSKASERWKNYGDYIDRLIDEREKIQQENEQRAIEYLDIQASLAKANEELKTLKTEDQAESQKLHEAIKTKNDLELKLASAQSDIDNYRNKIEAINFVQTKQIESSPAEEVIDVQQIAETSSDSLWSFVGTFRDKVYVDRTNFQIDQLPQEGTTITATVDVYRRSREPRYSLVRGWTLGDTKGVIKAGEELSIEEVELIPAKGGGYRVWVRGSTTS